MQFRRTAIGYCPIADRRVHCLYRCGLAPPAASQLVTRSGAARGRGEASPPMGGRPKIMQYVCAFFILPSVLCLQCFDAVGWAAGRVSGL